MRIIKTMGYDEMSRKAAHLLFAQVVAKPDSVLGLATGSSVLGLYASLIDRFKSGDLDFSDVRTINLDEYVGLSPDNDQSYRYYMNDNFFNHINVRKENTHLPDGLAADPAAESERYNNLIESFGGADVQLLGLGLNGHIGFNEPAEEFPLPVHCVDLTESTIQANARFFERESDVPRRALTMGIQNIMMSRRVVLCVSGAAKAGILKEVLTGPVTPKVPGSILQLHPDLVVVADEEALSAMEGC